MLDIRTENTTKTRWSKYEALQNIAAIKSREKEFARNIYPTRFTLLILFTTVDCKQNMNSHRAQPGVEENILR